MLRISFTICKVLRINSLLIILFAACNSQKKEPLRLGLNIWSGYSVALIAEEKGYFKNEGLPVTLKIERNQVDLHKLLNSQELDALFLTYANAIKLNSEGFDLKIVYIIDRSKSADAIIGRSSIRSLKDLQNHSIGFETVGSFSHFFVLKILKKNNIDPTKVKLKNIPAMDLLTSLEKGLVDAGHSWEPVLSLAHKKGYRTLATAEDVPGAILDVLAVRKSYEEKYPRKVLSLVRALAKAQTDLRSDPKNFNELISSRLRMNEDSFRRGMGGIYLYSLEENRNIFSKDILFDLGSENIKLLRDNNFLSRKVILGNILEKKYVFEIGK